MPLAKPMLGSLVNRSNPLSKGLVGAWLFNEGSGGRVNDASGYGAAGTLSGTTLPSWLGGFTGHKLQFVGGADDYVNVPNAPQHNTYQLSIAAGLKRDTTTGVRGIVEKTDGTGYDAWNFYISFMQKLSINSNNAGTAVAGATTVPVGTLQHIGVTAQGGTNLTALYLNGVSDGVGTSNISLWLNTAYNLRIGAFNGATSSLNGSLEYLYVWNRILLPSEMQAVSIDPFGMFRPTRRPWLWVTGGAGTAYTKTLTEVVNAADTITRAFTRTRTDALGMGDTIVRAPGRVLADALAVADSIQRAGARTVTDAASLTDAVARGAARMVSDALTASDSVSRGAGRTITDSLGVADVYARGLGRTLTVTLGTADTFARVLTLSRTFTDAVSLADTYSGVKPGAPATGLRDVLVLVDTRDTLLLCDLRDVLRLADTRDTLTLL